MKRFHFIIFIVLLFCKITYASFPISQYEIGVNVCDNIILKNGQEISAKIIEITPVLIKYKRCGKTEGPLISLYKNDVIMIRYDDGSKDLFNQAEKSDKTSQSTKNDIPIGGILSLSFSLTVLLIPLPLTVAALFAGIGFISGIGSLTERYWGLALAGMIVGLIDLFILYHAFLLL